MSLRQAIKSKFRSDKSDIEKEADMTVPTIVHSFVEDEEERLLDDTQDECPHPEQDCAKDSCSVCYESQLAQLQEQLVAVMLENQQLVNEIKELKDETSIDQLMKQLEKEKERSRMLSEKLHEKEGSITSKSPRLRRFVRKDKHSGEKTKASDAGGESSGMTVILEKDDGTDLMKDTMDDEKELTAETPETMAVTPVEFPTKTRYERMRAWLCRMVTEFLEDFSETNVEDEDSTEIDQEGSPLTVRQLKENLVRFSLASKPVSNLLDNILALLRWNSPGTTFLAFSVYMYTVYHGWLLPLFLSLALCQLLLNFIRGWFSSPQSTRKHIHEDTDMGVSDKFQLVLHVARKVQNQLGHIADCLEKIKNLLLWQEPDVTAHLFFALIAALVASCIFPVGQLFKIGGLYLGIKLFIIDYVFHRFPRVQEKHDTTARLWRTLPTDVQLEKKHNRAELDKLVVNHVTGSSTSLTTENQNFCELFNLPPTETPLPSWHAGRRCTLINKDKSLTAAFKNGRLYLTNSFLCFERSKSSTPKNLVLALKNISKVEKAKPYPWLPGGGMAIEVTMDKSEKAYIFGAILNRDETLESIIEAGSKAGLMWASQIHDHEEPNVPTTSAVANKKQQVL